METPVFTAPAVATFIDNTDPNPRTKTYSFPFNINSLNWTYNMNTQSFDTVGGRVTQLLSVNASTMDLQGEAGSRKKLLNLYTVFKTLQDKQNQTKTSMTLNVNSRGLAWRVWLKQMSVAWDYTTVTYPYTMLFEIEQDISSSTTLDNTAMQIALNTIAQGIGINNAWNGLAPSDFSFQSSDIQNYSSDPQSWS